MTTVPYSSPPGYDVWLGNVRGNSLSRSHKWLTPDDPRFWEWSYDEMAKVCTAASVKYSATTASVLVTSCTIIPNVQLSLLADAPVHPSSCTYTSAKAYTTPLATRCRTPCLRPPSHTQYDMPAMWSYVLAAAGAPSLSYVGHSQGTTVLLAALSSQPELCGRLDRAVLLAPVAVAKHISSVPLLAMAAMGTDSVSSAASWGVRARWCGSSGVRRCWSVWVWVLERRCGLQAQGLE